LDGFALMAAQMEAKISVMQAQLEEIDGDFPQQIMGDMGGGSSEDYAFKVTATKDDATGLFEVKVLGGTAQVFGGTPNVYSDTDFTGIVDGEHIFVAFHMCDSSFVEVGTWEADIKHGDDATMLAYDAPEYLLFEIACVSEDYSRNVRQGHEGNIVMPAIANVVDVQTQLP
jgi:hypothetical protein